MAEAKHTAEWVVGTLLSTGHIGVVQGAKRYPNEDYARAAASDRQREKPFLSFVAVPATRWDYAAIAKAGGQ